MKDDDRTAPIILRPLHDEVDYDRALREVVRLWDAPAGSPEDDRFQVLVLLIEAYEREHHPLDPPDPVDAIRFRMEQRNLTADDLAAVLGVSQRRVLAVLRGRPLTLPMIRLWSTASASPQMCSSAISQAPPRRIVHVR